jgi:hypothetical protein
MEESMGIQLPNYQEDENIEIPKEMEVQIYRAATLANQQVVQQHH